MYRAVAAQDYRLAFTYLAGNATGPDGSRLTYPAFLQFARTMEGLAGPVTSFSVGAYNSVIVMTVERKKIGPYHAHLQMARQGWIPESIPVFVDELPNPSRGRRGVDARIHSIWEFQVYGT